MVQDLAPTCLYCQKHSGMTKVNSLYFVTNKDSKKLIYFSAWLNSNREETSNSALKRSRMTSIPLTNISSIISTYHILSTKSKTTHFSSKCFTNITKTIFQISPTLFTNQHECLFYVNIYLTSCPNKLLKHIGCWLNKLCLVFALLVITRKIAALRAAFF